MRILLACEESQAVTIAFRKLGHDAYSCDTQPCSGGHPEWHIHGNVLDYLDRRWDMLIGFPPCTHLASSGARWFPEKIADGRQQAAVDFFMKLVNAPIPKIAVENPIGIMSTKYRKPDQIIQPYQFGDPFKKSTCLWLKGLPVLTHTDVVEPKLKQYICADGRIVTFSADYETGFRHKTGDKDRARRAKTYPGIAEAMAKAWG